MGSSPTSLRPARVLLVENIHPGAADLLRESGMEVQVLDRALDESELVERIGDVDVIGIRSRTQLSGTVLDKAQGLTAIGAFCIGTNQIDLAAASSLGVAVFNAPFSNTRSVVELVISEIIALTRRLNEKDRQMHAGIWDKSATGAHEVRGRRLGIVGYGNIGSQLSVLAEAIGMSVSFYDTADRLALGNATRCETMEELLESVDVVSLHVDGRPDNRDMFGEAELARMRAGSLFLNLSRGFLVDHHALKAHLESGHLAGAAIDVFPKEPAGRGEAFESELRGLANVVLTPHIGGSTEEAQSDIGVFVARKLLDYLRSGSTAMSVNFPETALPMRAGAHLLVHVHRNTPGVLAAINAIFAEHEVNIEGQYLGTRNDIGYVITDISSEYTEEMLAQLRNMSETIRLRLL
ncbi:MAG: phosphoglycerate dehydrogenase [Acidimicrobiales bacterium]